MNIPWQERFPQNAALLPLLMNPENDQVMLVRLSEEDYRKFSFLDQRIVTPQLPRQWVNWHEISSIAFHELFNLHYIFHIGHVGSTLISRLLGECPEVLAVREPAILRQFAETFVTDPNFNSQGTSENFESRLSEVQNWLSRSFQPEQKVMIKASSFVSPLAEKLLENDDKAVFLYTSLDRYLQTILAGQASIQEADALADVRLLRLNRIFDDYAINKPELSPYQKIGLGWLCEMATLTIAYDNLSQTNIKWLDFDRFLSDPELHLKAAAEHFSLNMSQELLDKMLNGPIMNSYSKAPEYDYSPSLREDLLKEAAQKHAEGIRQTMQWVEKMAEHQPSVAKAIEQADKRP